MQRATCRASVRERTVIGYFTTSLPCNSRFTDAADRCVRQRNIPDVADWLGAQIEDNDHAMEWLHNFYKAEDGLQRPAGLWIDGHPDYTGISTWILGMYLGNRLRGQTEAQARQAVENAIRQSDEWRTKHGG